MVVTKKQAERKALFDKVKSDPAKHLPSKELEEVLDHTLFCECQLCKQYWNNVAQSEQVRRTIDDADENNYVDDPSHSPQEKE